MSVEIIGTPNSQVSHSTVPMTPVDYDRSFLLDQRLPSGGFDALAEGKASGVRPIASFRPNPYYEHYLKIGKDYIAPDGADVLEEVHERLKGEDLPKYVAAAGWAAIEASVRRTDGSRSDRRALMNEGAKCLVRALRQQQALNERDRAHSNDDTLPYRLAMDLATLPLFAGIVNGNVSPGIAERAFVDSLNVAQANIAAMKVAGLEGDIEAFRAHVGFGYECNGLLALNRMRSQTWFAVPSTLRSDSGNHNGDQTHDLAVVHQRWGTLLSMTPVEIKGNVTRDDKQRYDALLVRGKMHLSANGKFLPEDTLDAIAATYELTGTPAQKRIADGVTNKFQAMIRDYNAGDRLPDFSSPERVCSFRDKSLVVARHPGLAVA